MKGIFNKTAGTILNSYLLAALFLAITLNAKSQYLRRSLSDITEVKTGLSNSTAHYKPFFGEGDNDQSVLKGIARYGNLTIDPGGMSNIFKFDNEEQVLFILEGTGILNIDSKNVPVSRNDFMYIPEGMKFGLSNPREGSLSVIIMGFKISPDTCKSKSHELMIANCDEVRFQTLPSHGPTTTFQLLMGTTQSTRDKLAAACQVNSLFIMDFAAGGTNNPHRHDSEEEIYFILRGKGDIVAGENSNGGELRHPSSEGDVYFFSPKTLIGFYSGNKEEEEHARILAVRFKFPSGSKNK
jgi:mannose-6-phosphate isomerase-like protein (cupin superfamily)